ncbi:STAS domain-containing protein [Planococcus salinarum]|uniref:STAS domain-containing protein n=1 Tax=Planococcus salinarum TaxID=622695 RepID=UPI000E3E24D6|nr:STAS domain-containing protein [Planococcus salinarum]TAA73063.1 STAS domain-containing protein [Planococcus salinarum]
MDTILYKIAEFIKEENKSLTENLLRQATNQLQLELTEEQLAKHYELIGLLLDKVSIGLLSTRQETQEMELDYDIDRFFYYDGTLLKKTVEIISTFRLSLLQEIQNRGLLESSDASEVSRLYHHVIYIFDDAIRKTTKNFNLENQKILAANEQEIMELAAPIVPIKSGIGIMPLIGEFTDSRAVYLSKEVIPKIVDMDIERLVIDFSGIHHFDTNVAQQIFQIRDILQLLGIQPVVTGIRPVIAQTAVSLGINMSDIQTYGTVKEFLEVMES